MKKSFYYRVQEGDTINSLVQKFNTEIEHILRNRNDLPLYVGEWIFVSVNDYATHYVKPMENLDDIANRYGITVEKLKRDNDLKDSKLFIGERLKIYK